MNNNTLSSAENDIKLYTLEQLKEKYNISESFFRRYFEQNALNRFGTSSLKFMWFKEGTFLNPIKKNNYIDNFIKDEILDFYENKSLVMPQIEFCITTKCSLKCKDCNALIPRFNKLQHIDMSVDEFCLNLDKLCNSVDMIRHFTLLGGEPLLHPNFANILEYTCQKDNIFLIKIITNGTIIPSKDIIDVVNKYRTKVYFYISNYGVNEKLQKLLKHNEIISLLKQNNIRYQIVDNWEWYRECGFADKKFAPEHVQKNFDKCCRTQCLQLLNSKIDICSKASTARETGMLNLDDYIDITDNNLRQKLIDFYQKPYQQACEYCILSDESVLPALQD